MSSSVPGVLATQPSMTQSFRPDRAPGTVDVAWSYPSGSKSAARLNPLMRAACQLNHGSAGPLPAHTCEAGVATYDELESKLDQHIVVYARPPRSAA